jgi:hypothetical protein
MKPIAKFTARDRLIVRYAIEAYKLAHVSYPRRQRPRRPAKRPR